MAGTNVEFLTADSTKSLSEELWTCVIENINRENVGIVIPCNNYVAVNIYKSYMTGNVGDLLDKNFKKKNKLFSQIATKIQDGKLEDQIHFLPVATHLRGHDPIPKAAIDRDLANIRDHLYSNKWKIIIFREKEENTNLYLYQKKHLVLYDTLMTYEEYNGGKKSEPQNTQGKYIEWMVNEFALQYDQHNIDANIKITQKPVPLSARYYLSKYFRSYFGMKDLSELGEFSIEFSPSYNIRIYTQDDAALEFTVSKLADLSCQKYVDLKHGVKARIIMSRRKAHMASIIFNQGYEFFSRILVPTSTIEHYYRYQFVNVHYGAIPTQTPMEKKDQLLNKNKGKYIDIQLEGGNPILLNGSLPLSFEEFEDGGYFASSFMQRRNDAPALLRGRENIPIEEQNILDPLRKINLDYRKKRIARRVLNPFYYKYPIPDEFHIKRDISGLLPLTNCANFLERKQIESTTKRDSMLELLDYYYVSLTFAIYNMFELHSNPRDWDTSIFALTQFADEDLYFYLNSLFRSCFAPADRSPVFITWFFVELAVLAFFKGNFLLFEVIVRVLKVNESCLIALTHGFQESSILLEFLTQLLRGGLGRLFDNAGTRILLQQRYLEQYNMVIFPHPSLMKTIRTEVAAHKLPSTLLLLFDNVHDKIQEQRWDASGLRLRDTNIFQEILHMPRREVALAPLAPITVTAEVVELVHYLDEISVCKGFLSIFEYDFSKGSCWDEFCRLHMLRDSAEIKNFVSSFIPEGRSFSLHRLLSLNFVPILFIEGDLEAFLKSFNLDKAHTNKLHTIINQFLQ